MLTFLVLFSIAVVLLTIWVVSSLRIGQNLPPGPWRLPLLGSTSFMDIPYWRWAYNQRDKFPKLIYFHQALSPMLILNSYEMVKEAMITKGDYFVGRQKIQFFKKVLGPGGIILADGPIWRLNRRFTLRVLRDFGFGRSLSQDQIQSELDYMHKAIEQNLEKPVQSSTFVGKAVANVICQLVFGSRLASEDPNFDEVIHAVNTVTQSGERLTESAFRFLVTQIMMKVMIHTKLIDSALVGGSPTMKKNMARFGTIRSYCQNHIDSHRKQYNVEEEPRDYIESYLQEAHAHFNNPDPSVEKVEGELEDDVLISIIVDLFLAGTDTTTNTLRWALLYLAINPDVLHKLHAQIDKVLGQDKTLSMSDKRHLPYLEAVVEETNRLCTLVPQSVLHRVVQDVEIGGHFVPEDTIVISNIYAVHHDERFFPQPDEFKPERFLDSDGSFKSIEQVIPFSIGRRACLGESLARMELFIFLGGLAQRYRLSVAEEDVPRLPDILSGTIGGIHAPKDHRIVFHKR